MAVNVKKQLSCYEVAFIGFYEVAPPRS